MGIEESSHQGTIAGQILADLKTSLGDAWASIGDRGRQILAECAEDAAGLQIAALAADTDAKREAIAKEKRFVDAALANVQAAGVASVSGVFWEAFNRVAARGLDALTVVIAAAL
jgi:hypothetical protein